MAETITCLKCGDFATDAFDDAETGSTRFIHQRRGPYERPSTCVISNDDVRQKLRRREGVQVPAPVGAKPVFVDVS